MVLPKSGFFDRLKLNVGYQMRMRRLLGASFPVRLWMTVWLSVRWALNNLPTLFGRHVELPYLEVMVTQKCNLRCKHCSNLMPYFKNPTDVPFEKLKEDIAALLNAVDRIYLLKVLGGEPFLYQNLTLLLEFLQDLPQIEQIEVVTNGTLLPKERTLKALTHRKIKVIISPYSRAVAKNADAMMDAFDAYGIQYAFPDLEKWKDFGGFDPRGRTDAENERMFRDCFTCVTLTDGEIYCCPRAANGVALGLVPKVAGEYAAVRDRQPADIAKDLAALGRLKVISTCERCDNPGPEIPIAEQLPPP